MARIKKRALKMIVTQNRVFSIPRRAVKTPPASEPVRFPSPAPLLCKMILITSAIDVKIKETSNRSSNYKLEDSFLKLFNNFEIIG